MTSSADPWVGTWRPHRPKGPIAAFYSSPGPKYGLPGLTGKPSEDPTKHTAPAYSIGARHSEFRVSCSPGPAYVFPSNITRTGRDGAPAFSLHSRPKEVCSFKGPGPGQYSPENAGKVIFPCAPAFSLSARRKEYTISQTPGPDNYTLPPVLGPKSVDKPSGPAYSIYGRSKSGSFLEDLKKTPGPADYKTTDPHVYKHRPPQFSMTGRNFTPGETSQKPGPGTYHPEQVTFTKAKAPSFSFGLRHSDYITPLITKTDNA